MGGHGVQDIEGFATGGVPDTFKSSRYETDVWREAHRLANADEQSLLEMTEGAQKKYLAAARDNLYTRLAGETEARNVQNRRDFTPEQRRARPPWETQDVPDDQQIVRFGSGKAESRPKPPPNRLASGPQKGKPSTLIANTRATKPMATEFPNISIDMPANGNRGRVSVKSGDSAGEITFERNERGDFVIKESGIDPDIKGTGLGIQMYEALAQRAAQSKRALYSDSLVSGDAVKIYMALKRRGYNVRLANPKDVWENPNYRPSTWDENKNVLFPAGPKSKPGTMVAAPSDLSVFKVTKYAALVGAGGPLVLVMSPSEKRT
jgi:predicted GNAT family acetyltransferase